LLAHGADRDDDALLLPDRIADVPGDVDDMVQGPDGRATVFLNDELYGGTCRESGRGG
jgi:hypothetical protein